MDHGFSNHAGQSPQSVGEDVNPQAAYSTVPLQDGRSVRTGHGGALYAKGEVISVSSTFSDNVAMGGAGGPSLSGVAPGAHGGDGNGGALYALK